MSEDVGRIASSSAATDPPTANSSGRAAASSAHLTNGGATTGSSASASGESASGGGRTEAGSNAAEVQSPVQTPYQGDRFLEPKEGVSGRQSLRASREKARISQAELAQKRRHDEDRLAEDIIEECRVQLMLKFRFLDRALWRMSLNPQRQGMAYPIATTGKLTYYDPQRVIARFRQSFDESVRDYLHMVMHCIFRHPFDRTHRCAEAWSLACDMTVESVTMDLCGTRFPSEEDAARKGALDEVALAAGSLLPNKVYDFLAGLVQAPDGQHYQGIGRGKLNEWHQLFERDDHAAWPANANQDDGEGPRDEDSPSEEMLEDEENPEFQSDGLRSETLGNDESGEEESRSSQGGDEDSGEDGDNEAPDEDADDAGTTHFDSSEADRSSDDEDDSKRDWEELAKEIEMNLETFSKEWGEEAGNLMATLALANRRTYDYTDFLRKFMTVTEQIRLNPEEFDYTYYTFGMDMYGNMPFIEPLEYKEAESIRDFVIAIDTSESVSGPLVKRFIEHTFSILKESEDFNTDVNIHIVQADSKVQSDLKVTDVREVDRLLQGFAVRGFGGTDFRPTFDYVSMLRRRGELADMKGLIYFTDGMGTFPEKPPDYETAFVFVDDGTRELPPVPPWAARLTIDERDIERL